LKKPSLTYANVTSSIALFVALGGVSYAATALPVNSVGTTQIKDKAVTGGKLSDGAVTAGKLGTGAVAISNLGAATLLALKGAPGAKGETGAAGARGDVGAKGDRGPSSAYVANVWPGYEFGTWSGNPLTWHATGVSKPESLGVIEPGSYTYIVSLADSPRFNFDTSNVNNQPSAFCTFLAPDGNEFYSASAGSKVQFGAFTTSVQGDVTVACSTALGAYGYFGFLSNGAIPERPSLAKTLTGSEQVKVILVHVATVDVRNTEAP